MQAVAGGQHAAQGKTSRAPGALNLAVGMAIALLLAFLALTAHSAEPPPIAEFAPQVQQQIKQAPAEQSSSFGGAGGGAGAGAGAAASPTPSAAAAAPPSPPPNAVYLHCVGDPPRQTEDPQSPPCVPYWTGDNHVKTWKGVDGSTINVAFFNAGDEWGAGAKNAVNALQHFFNTRYELYGRHFNIQPFSSAGATPANQHQDAATVDGMNVFAALPGNAYSNANNGGNFYFNDDLADRHVITVMSWPMQTLTESHIAAHAPYEWTFQMPIDVAGANLAEFYCKSLNGRAPRWAGAPQSTAAKRVLGVIQEVTPDGTVWDDQTLVDGLSGCGVSPFVYKYTGGDATALNNGIQAMQAHNVTTITCLCEGNHLSTPPADWTSTAESAHYYPEWIINDFGGQDNDDQGQLAASGAPGQANHRIGITSQNKMLPLPNMPWWWAVKEGDPTSNAAAYGAQNWYYGANYLYQALLELASGIQMAGPQLTPDSFQHALQTTIFPDPGAGGPPMYQGRVGFPGGSHTFIQDMVPIWWNNTAQSTYWNGYTGGIGAYCYVDRGIRYGPGMWRTTEPAFYSGTCQ